MKISAKPMNAKPMKAKTMRANQWKSINTHFKQNILSSN